MLEATFIGHQGWLLSTGRTNVLVDPLLTEGFGHGGLAGTVFPPRRFDVARMPSIDAVWLTHEHDDHFDLPSLCTLDRAVPVYISGRSSVAMHSALAALGFTVHRVAPNTRTSLGDLTLQTFVADHRATPLSDEWDVLPFLAADAAGHGAFVSSVDVAMPDALLDAVATAAPRAWMLCIANNTTDVRFVEDGIGRVHPTDDTDALAGVLTRRWKHAASRAGAPALTAVTGGGWSHPSDLAWVDRLAFSIDPDRLATALSQRCDTRATAVRPGATLVLGDDVQETNAPWVESVPATRPLPEAVDVPATFEPACGVRQLAPNAWPHLEAGLSDLARFLYGRSFFTAAQSLAADDPLGILLHDDNGDRTYAWSPRSASFEPTTRSTFACRLRLWATDLLALFEGELAPSALCYTGRLRVSNRDPQSLRISPMLLWSFAHPLHRPEAARKLYAGWRS